MASVYSCPLLAGPVLASSVPATFQTGVPL